MEKVEVKRYDKYKDSGVEWLGVIPAHWDTKTLGAVFELKSDKNHPDFQVLSVYRDYGVILKDSRDDNHNATSLDTSNYKAVEPGDLVVNKMKAWQGSMGISNFKGIVSPAYITCKPKLNNVDSDFLHYLVRCNSYIGEYNRLSYGVRVGQWDMHYEDFKKVMLVLPSHAEQTAIANFLDDKCGKIDQAIAQKQKLIELLKERKQILIQNAVTKGLDPKVKMKDSGVEWIGEIPEGWEVKRLKFILKEPLKYGANESGIEYKSYLPRYVRITDFSGDGRLNEEKKLSLPSEIGRNYLLEDGDILFARSGATVGKSYQFKKNMSVEKEYAFAGYLIKASPNESSILSDFLNYYTFSGSFESWKNAIFNKATIENIGADKYSELKVPIPPISEQKLIVDFIQTQSIKIDKAIALQEEQIEKLKEYKASLINSAVTGKIKVC